MLRTTELYKFY